MPDYTAPGSARAELRSLAFQIAEREGITARQLARELAEMFGWKIDDDAEHAMREACAELGIVLDEHERAVVDELAPPATVVCDDGVRRLALDGAAALLDGAELNELAPVPGPRFAECKPSGFVLLEAGPVVPADDGVYAHCAVLAEREHRSDSPYIVWELIMPTDRPAYCVWGGYYATRDAADRDFRGRIGRHGRAARGAS